MLQNVYCVPVDVIQGAISLPAGSAAFSVPPSFPGQRGWSRAASPTCALTSTAGETCLALAMPWCHLPNTCGQDLSLRNNREIMQLLKGLGGKNITPRMFCHLPTSPRAPNTCTGSNFTLHFLSCCGHLCARRPWTQNLTIYFGSAYMTITWLLVGFVLENQGVLHLLAWSKDTNSSERHSWVMPCRIPGEQAFTCLFFCRYKHLYLFHTWTKLGGSS